MSISYPWITPEIEIIQQLRDIDLIGYITNSSAYHKGIIRKIPTNPTRKQLIKLYQRCRQYATSSIVNGLTPPSAITHQLDCSSATPFRILARVRTECDMGTTEYNALCRSYQSFSILENQNLSHFPGEVLYGYYTGVTPEMIGYIYPMDANTAPTAECRLDLALSPEIILDLEDLVEKARKHHSYCQLSIFTRCKTADNKIVPLRPDRIIAINDISPADREAAEIDRLPIVTIRQAPGTLYHVHDDCLEAQNWTEWILPLDPNAPRYDEYDDFDLTTPDARFHPDDPTCNKADFLKMLAQHHL